MIGPLILMAMFVCLMLAAVDLKPHKRCLETLLMFQPHHPHSRCPSVHERFHMSRIGSTIQKIYRKEQEDIDMTKKHEKSSDNIFADSRFSNSEQELVSAKLTAQIYRLLRDQGLAQAEAAKLLGTTHGQISALMHCLPVSVSVNRLIEFLTALGQDVKITVKPIIQRKNCQRGHMSVALPD